MAQSGMTIKDLSKIMKELDIAMLATKTHGGKLGARPMSNNRDVEFDGDTFFFSRGDTTTIADIKSDPQVGVTYADDRDGIYIALQGEAKLHTDKALLKEHWKPALEKWFEDGLQTDGLTLIEVNATRAHYWKGREEGEIVIGR